MCTRRDCDNEKNKYTNAQKFNIRSSEMNELVNHNLQIIVIK